MFRRLPNPLQSKGFFLFGARGTGKSTLVGELLKGSATHRIDLLDRRIFDEYLTRPCRLLEQFQSNASFEWIVVDEVQRLPRLLNEVHKLIIETKQKFVLTGSSARKLKRGEANLLAGRAFSYELFPLTHLEYGKLFSLHDVLQWGALPQVATTTIAQVRSEYLAAYVSTYMREEVLAEQLVRNLEGFRKFLKVAAQVNGQIVVYDSIARDVGIDATTVKTYFEILSDTLLGFALPSYHRSVRKQQRKAPKFYFFDCGVQRALLGIADQELTESSYG